MIEDSGFSDEHLNAFVDDELDGAETNRVIEALNQDPQLSLKVSELRKLKELARYAYSTPAKARRAARLATSRLLSSAIAAGLLGVGVAAGWYWHVSTVSGGGNTIGIGANAAKTRGIVVQVSENDPVKWDIALANVKNIRKEFPVESMDIEIVAYGPGLEMFKKESPLDQRLSDAAKSGVRLLACGNTMDATRTTRGQLNASVGVVKAGVIEIMQKQEQGYSYIRP